MAISETEARCSCNAGFSGDSCELIGDACDDECSGNGGVWPYGCNPNLSGVVQYGCGYAGGCNYLQKDQEYPHPEFCTFKVQEFDCLENGSVFKVNQLRNGEVIWSGDVKVWSGAFGHINIEPLMGGAFQDGDQIKPWAPIETSNPSKMVC